MDLSRRKFIQTAGSYLLKASLAASLVESLVACASQNKPAPKPEPKYSGLKVGVDIPFEFLDRSKLKRNLEQILAESKKAGTQESKTRDSLGYMFSIHNSSEGISLLSAGVALILDSSGTFITTGHAHNSTDYVLFHPRSKSFYAAKKAYHEPKQKADIAFGLISNPANTQFPRVKLNFENPKVGEQIIYSTFSVRTPQRMPDGILSLGIGPHRFPYNYHTAFGLNTLQGLNLLGDAFQKDVSGVIVSLAQTQPLLQYARLSEKPYKQQSGSPIVGKNGRLSGILSQGNYDNPNDIGFVGAKEIHAYIQDFLKRG